jgi:hypothetical protein
VNDRLTHALFSINHRLFSWRTRQIHKTPPIPCDPGAPCEVHTMLGHRDVDLYLVAIKSLLRWSQRLAVVVHSDGSLDRTTLDHLRRHIPGARIVEPPEADSRAREMLKDRPALLRWRAHDAAYRRLIDVELARRTPRRIVLDADVIVLREPAEALRWAESGTLPFLLGQPPHDEGQELSKPAESAHVQAHFRYAVPRLAAATGLAPRFLQGTTAGFHGCTDQLQLNRVEDLLRACESLGLRMTQWGGDQCCIIYLLSAADGQRLDPTRCFNFEPSLASAAADAEVIHFYGTYRFHGGVYTGLARSVISQLGVSQ